MAEAYFGFYLLSMRGGRPVPNRSGWPIAEGWLHQGTARSTPLPMQCSVMEAFT